MTNNKAEENNHQEAGEEDPAVVATTFNRDEETSHYCQQRSYFRFNFSQLCRFTVSLPLVGLVICFVSANIFQQHDIHETHCRVNKLKNITFIVLLTYFYNY